MSRFHIHQALQIIVNRSVHSICRIACAIPQDNGDAVPCVCKQPLSHL